MSSSTRMIEKKMHRLAPTALAAAILALGGALLGIIGWMDQGEAVLAQLAGVALAILSLRGE